MGARCQAATCWLRSVGLPARPPLSAQRVRLAFGGRAAPQPEPSSEEFLLCWASSGWWDSEGHTFQAGPNSEQPRAPASDGGGGAGRPRAAQCPQEAPAAAQSALRLDQACCGGWGGPSERPCLTGCRPRRAGGGLAKAIQPVTWPQTLPPPLKTVAPPRVPSLPGPCPGPAGSPQGQPSLLSGLHADSIARSPCGPAGDQDRLPAGPPGSAPPCSAARGPSHSNPGRQTGEGLGHRSTFSPAWPSPRLSSGPAHRPARRKHIQTPPGRAGGIQKPLPPMVWAPRL